jgi:hypothetical protein
LRDESDKICSVFSLTIHPNFFRAKLTLRAGGERRTNVRAEAVAKGYSGRSCPSSTPSRLNTGLAKGRSPDVGARWTPTGALREGCHSHTGSCPIVLTVHPSQRFKLSIPTSFYGITIKIAFPPLAEVGRGVSAYRHCVLTGAVGNFGSRPVIRGPEGSHTPIGISPLHKGVSSSSPAKERRIVYRPEVHNITRRHQIT